MSAADAMTDEPRFPPPFRALAIDRGSAFDAALAKAAAGADPGTLVWLRSPDCFDCAVVLAPSEPLEPSLPVAYVTLLGLGDALGALGPPNIPVTFGWPDRVAVNGAVIGGIRIRAAATSCPNAIPDWLVVGASVRLRNDPGTEPGEHPDITALVEEGYGEIEAGLLAESFSRHFLLWMNRWQDDGLAPVIKAWLEHFDGSRELTIELDGKHLSGAFTGLDAGGALLLGQTGNVQPISLADALRRPSWSPLI